MVEIVRKGNYKILTPLDWLPKYLMLIEEAGRTCYQSDRGEINQETANKFIRMLIKRGHHSQLEHSLLTVRFDNCSRGFTHELVRHRLMAISQESTRYVDHFKGSDEINLDAINIKFIVPPHQNENEPVQLPDGSMMSATEMASRIEMFYQALRQGGWKPEDARQILPNGLKSEIVVSCNLREWRHIFYMRTEKYAHWEIRAIMCALLKELKTIIPVMFEDFAEDTPDNNGVACFKQIKL